MNPTKEFRDYLISQGAALVGIGDLTAVPSSDYPVGIAVAIPLPKHVIKDLQLAPTREYYKLYTTLNDKLNAIVTAGEKCRKDFFSSDRCPADLRCSGYTLSVRCLSCLRPVLPGTCTEKYIVAFGYATRRYRICFCML